MQFFNNLSFIPLQLKKTILKFASGFWLYLVEKENTFFDKK